MIESGTAWFSFHLNKKALNEVTAPAQPTFVQKAGAMLTLTEAL